MKHHVFSSLACCIVLCVPEKHYMFTIYEHTSLSTTTTTRDFIDFCANFHICFSNTANEQRKKNNNRTRSKAIQIDTHSGCRFAHCTFPASLSKHKFHFWFSFSPCHSLRIHWFYGVCSIEERKNKTLYFLCLFASCKWFCSHFYHAHCQRRSRSPLHIATVGTIGFYGIVARCVWVREREQCELSCHIRNY